MKLNKVLASTALVLLMAGYFAFFGIQPAHAETNYWPNGFTWSDKSITSGRYTFNEKFCATEKESNICEGLFQTRLAGQTGKFFITPEVVGGYHWAILVTPDHNFLYKFDSNWGTALLGGEATIAGTSTIKPEVSLGTGNKIIGIANVASRDGSGKPLGDGSNIINNELHVTLYDSTKENPLDLKGWEFGPDSRNFSATGSSYTWNTLTVNTEMFTNHVYVLKTSTEKVSNVNCLTGVKTDGNGANNLIQGDVCTLSYSGQVDFIITDDKKIQIVGNANDFEGDATDRPFPFTDDQHGLNLTISEYLNSPMDKALSAMIGHIADLATTLLNFTMRSIDWLLNNTEKIVLGIGVEGAWTKLRNVGISLMVFALIIIAFANTLQIDIDKYGLNRMIPKIIISIILAMTSWLLVTFFFDMVNALQGQAIGLMGGANGLKVLADTQITTPSGADIVGKIGAILTLIVILYLIVFAGVVLMFSLILRVIILSFLLAVAPLVFILNIMPFTEGLYKDWWKNFWSWMFMAPVALIIISLGSVIASGMGYNGATLNDSTVTDPSGMNILIGLIIFAASLFMAATLPLSWGGKIMGSWQKAGKSVGKSIRNWAGKESGVTGAYNNLKNRMGERTALRQNVRAAKISRKLTGDRVGTSPDVLRRAEEDAQVQKYSKEFDAANATGDELRAATIKGGPRAIAAYQKLAATDQLETKDLDHMYQTMGEQRGDAALMGMRKKHPEWFISQNHGGAPGQPEGAATTARAALGTKLKNKTAFDGAFNFDNIMGGMKQDDVLDLNHNSFKEPAVANRLNLNATSASKLTGRQVEALTGGNTQNVSNILGRQTIAGFTHRDDINQALASGDITALNMAVNNFKTELGAQGINIPQMHQMSDRSLAEVIKAGKF